ncbi:MAG: helix-turn-helix transcriptional regulator [Ruminococcaceae bacterium]|nr:helix-turn-helix transcriptional regulator [Oscillospiraceae bacterium]
MTKSYFGDNLYTLRKQRGLSQDEFAEKMGVSRQAISKWERNESYPDTDNLIAIAKFFNVTIDDMINTPLEAQPAQDTALSQAAPEVFDADNSEDDDDLDDDEQDSDSKPTISLWLNVPYPIIVTIAYLLWGFMTGYGWGIGWVLYVTIPVYYSIIDCVRSKRLTRFNYPVFVTFIFLLFGMLFSVWHPLWVLYLTIPIYYPIASGIDRAMRNKRK